MRRALLVTAGTAAGVAAVLIYAPSQADTGNSDTVDVAGPSVAASQAAGSPTEPSSPSAASPSGTQRTIAGPVVQTDFGPVQVEVTVEGTTITAARALQTPDGTPHSVKIAKKAVPVLQQETLAAQSADIAKVSGASYTSDGWQKSLAGALEQITAVTATASAG